MVMIVSTDWFDIGTSPERSEHPLKVGISYGPEMGDSPGADVVPRKP